MPTHHCQCTNSPTFYEILSLSPSSLSASAEDPAATARLIKRAYRRALLSHHPDKQTPGGASASASFTIDQISAAYATLSRPDLREAYDRALFLRQPQQQQQQQQQRLGPSCCGACSCGHRGFSATDFQTGIEIVDLDDLECSTTTDANGEEETRWYRSCRCGNPRGYEFGEADLEEAADLGELMVGCADCSLWLRVQFAVIEEEEEDGEGTPGTGKTEELGSTRDR
ncbi:hypothetical protein VTJ83DRAFT_670 [Remersonia thermophila]|uniref:Diphthamide biosynthesis protein 4 n=1 Tax=Remersonia thermophila TaxID=72144 RepID=A0ABR4DLM4_9PEZI